MQSSGSRKDSILEALDKDWASFVRDYRAPADTPTQRLAGAAKLAPSTHHPEAQKLNFDDEEERTERPDVFSPPKTKKPRESRDEQEMELIRAKAEASALGIQLRKAKLEAADAATAHAKALAAERAEAQARERRILELEAQLDSMRTSATEAEAEMGKLVEARRAELARSPRRSSTSSAALLSPQASASELSEERLRALAEEVRSLKANLREAEREKEEAAEEAEGLRASQARLSDELHRLSEAETTATGRCLDLAAELRDWKAAHLGYEARKADLARLQSLERETAAAKAETERHRAGAENIALLRQRLADAEADRDRQAKAKAAILNELNALKLGLCKATGWETTSEEADAAAEALTAMQQRLQAAEAELATLRAGGGMAPLRDRGEEEAGGERIFHLRGNPADEAQAEWMASYHSLKAERDRLALLLAAKANSTGEEEDGDQTLVARQATEEELRAKISSLEGSLERVKEQLSRTKAAYSEMGAQYRRLCLRLTGFEVKLIQEGDASEGRIVQVASALRQSPDDAFLFRLTGEEDLELMDTRYSANWMDLVETYLQQDNSIPAFLAAVTLQLSRTDATTTDIFNPIPDTSTTQYF